MTQPLGYYGLNLPTGEFESELRAANFEQLSDLFSDVAYHIHRTSFSAQPNDLQFVSNSFYADGDGIISNFSKSQLLALSKWLVERLDELLTKQANAQS